MSCPIYGRQWINNFVTHSIINICLLHYLYPYQWNILFCVNYFSSKCRVADEAPNVGPRVWQRVAWSELSHTTWGGDSGCSRAIIKWRLFYIHLILFLWHLLRLYFIPRLIIPNETTNHSHFLMLLCSVKSRNLSRKLKMQRNATVPSFPVPCATQVSCYTWLGAWECRPFC
jgi:hypothetical protein